MQAGYYHACSAFSHIFFMEAATYLTIAMELVIGYAPKFILAVCTLAVGFQLVKVLQRMVSKAFSIRHVDDSLAGFLESMVSIVLKTLVVITVASMIGVQMTSFVALIGAAGLAIGLSLQGSLANLAGGVLILLFKPYKVGDFVEVAGYTGTVHKIDIVSTILKTPDNKTVVIPNGESSNGSILNFSTEKNRRVDMVFGIGYDDDITKAKKVLADIVSKDERIRTEPEPQIVVGNLGESSVDIFCRVWVESANYWPVFFDMQETVKLTFDTENISIPYPQRDVHMSAQNSEQTKV
jgi:small conductance mechanosensitive channel